MTLVHQWEKLMALKADPLANYKDGKTLDFALFGRACAECGTTCLPLWREFDRAYSAYCNLCGQPAALLAPKR